MNHSADVKATNSEWQSLYKVGGAAALVAGLLFRRNLAAEVGLFGAQPAPVTVKDWFVLLQSNRLLGLTYLNIFDLVNYALVALMFLALTAALNRVSKSSMAVATTLALAGVMVYFASNTAFSMLALSDEYADAASETQRTILLSAGQALLAINRFSTGAHPGSAGFVSLLFLAAAALITSVLMLRSRIFNRLTAYVGILAGAFDLAYCLAYVFVPVADKAKLALIFIPAAGLFLAVWHILVGWRLWQMGRAG